MVLNLLRLLLFLCLPFLPQSWQRALRLPHFNKYVACVSATSVQPLLLSGIVNAGIQTL